MPPANSRSCAKTAIGNLTSGGFGTQEDWDTFSLGVEAVLQFEGPTSNFNLAVQTAIIEAVANEVGVLPAGVQLEVTAGFNDFTHLWIRMKDLNPLTPDDPDSIAQGQQVRNNLTAVLEDVEIAQSFFNRALESAGITEITADAAAGRRASEVEADVSLAALIVLDSIPVPPTVMCFPAAGAAASIIGLLGLLAGGACIVFDVIYYLRKRGACGKGEGGDEDGEGEEGEEEEEEEVPEVEDDDDKEAGDKDDDKDGDDEAAADLIGGAQVNESDIDLLEFLNAASTPGMDDHEDLKVNPVLLYVIEREKKLEKARAEAEAAAEGDGEGGGAAETSVKADDGLKRDFKVSATKRLGWSLSKDAAVAADTTKQVKNIEAYLSKSLDIDVKKTAMIRSTHAGEKTHNAMHASELAAIANRGSASDDFKKQHEFASAEAARSQLRLMKLKTRVELEEEAAPEKAEGDGEEGEEGDGDADAVPI